MLQEEGTEPQVDETGLVPIPEIVKAFGIRRGTLYQHMDRLGIKPQRFFGDKRAFVTTEECEKMMRIRRKVLALKREWENKTLVLEP